MWAAGGGVCIAWSFLARKDKAYMVGGLAWLIVAIVYANI
jgi:hypothetical protein